MADPRTLSLMAAAAVVLAGCAGTHVGDDWQCPAAQGSQCTSVGTADPAVPEVTQPWDPVHRAELPGRESAARDPACGRGCDPLEWLAALVAGIGGGGSEPVMTGEVAGADVAGVAAPDPAPADLAGADDAAKSGGEAASPAALEVVGEGLREPEAIARVWIAPYVDADGVYREASWVRVVIEPARWRLP